MTAIGVLGDISLLFVLFFVLLRRGGWIARQFLQQPSGDDEGGR